MHWTWTNDYRKAGWRDFLFCQPDLFSGCTVSSVFLGNYVASIEENAFNNKSVWARMAVIFGGPFFNFILAFIFSIIVIGMSGADIPKISKVEKDSPAYEAGIRKGDTMIKVAGKKMHNYREFSYYMYLDYDGGKIPITILQNGKEKNITSHQSMIKNEGNI